MNPSTRNPRRPLVAGVIVVVLAVLGYFAWTHLHHESAHDHASGHDHASHASTALTLNAGRRWATDEPLRLGMQRIRDAVLPVLGGSGQRTVSPSQAKAMAESIQAQVNFLFQNCKLEPAADAALHVLITEILAGAAAVALDPAAKTGPAQLLGALRKYPEYFDHPNWQPLPAPAL
jgi:hypothetical protein